MLFPLVGLATPMLTRPLIVHITNHSDQTLIYQGSSDESGAAVSVVLARKMIPPGGKDVIRLLLLPSKGQNVPHKPLSAVLRFNLTGHEHLLAKASLWIYDPTCIMTQTPMIQFEHSNPYLTVNVTHETDNHWQTWALQMRSATINILSKSS